MTRYLCAAVCTFLAACATTQPPKPEPVPQELVPPGFSAADCRVTDPGGAITETGADGLPRTVGARKPKVECNKQREGAVVVKTVPMCRTTGGKELPLADCCMTESGDRIPACTPKLQEPE